jgi:aryl-alcohol dehydrogenase-like predicted oxidoreductase
VRYVEVGGQDCSVIGLGTWQFGSREWGYGDTYARDVAPAILRRAVELGVTFIDTAEANAFGRSERIVGETIAGLPGEARARLVVGTKLVPALPLPRIVEWQARGIRRRLGMDSIDLYQVHFPNPLVSPKATMKPLRRLVEAGAVRSVGVSNHSLARWQASDRALRRPVASNQVEFSLLAPDPLRDLVPFAREHGRAVIAYSPLGRGLLSAMRHAQRGRPAGIRRRMPAFGRESLARLEPLFGALREIAATHEATPAQVSLAWLIGHGSVIAIPGARTVEQLEENVAAADLVLTTDEHVRLTEASLGVSAG